MKKYEIKNTGKGLHLLAETIMNEMPQQPFPGTNMDIVCEVLDKLEDLKPELKECSHCKCQCIPIELDEDTHEQIDFYGIESLQEVQQAIYEGITICEDCYHKEGGI